MKSEENVLSHIQINEWTESFYLKLRAGICSKILCLPNAQYGITLKVLLIFIAFCTLTQASTGNFCQYIEMMRIYNLYYPFKMTGVPVKLRHFPCATSWDLQWKVKHVFNLSCIYPFHILIPIQMIGEEICDLFHNQLTALHIF